ncbi:MAG: Glu-tRNA(Gln) amidotransferase subunit GatD [Nanoarchaeota archaeon]|nr:Glu-tRNA(Gln) amidotransferase subunit GatD [Nanoarchaeota archaeon]
MAKAGDLVEIVTKDKKYRGILMPKPEILKSNSIVIKLDSGYNVGIDKKKIKKIKVIKKAKPKKEKKKKIKQNKKLPTVSILSTGGTISSKVDYTTGGTYASLTAEDFVELEPKLLKFANIRAKRILQLMSEDVNPDDWIKIAKEIYRELNKKDVTGVVVTHGTDTLHYTASILSFMFPKLSKPIVLVGAQRSTDRGSSDTFMNLICSVISATQNIGEVLVCMHATPNDDFCYLHRATKVRKMHTSRRDAFRSINQFPIAKVFPDGRIEILVDYKKPDEKTELDVKIDKKVALVYVYPGMDPKILDYYAKKKYHGIVLMGTGLGHVPTNGKLSLIPKIKSMIKKGIAVCITSQCLYGRTHEFVYSNLRKLESVGAIFCEDMLPETAYTKLMFVLGKTRKLEKVKELMQKNLRGEINKTLSVKMFMN